MQLFTLRASVPCCFQIRALGESEGLRDECERERQRQRQRLLAASLLTGDSAPFLPTDTIISFVHRSTTASSSCHWLLGPSGVPNFPSEALLTWIHGTLHAMPDQSVDDPIMQGLGWGIAGEAEMLIAETSGCVCLTLQKRLHHDYKMLGCCPIPSCPSRYRCTVHHHR